MRLVAKLLLYIGFFKHTFENQKSGGVRGGLGSRRGRNSGWRGLRLLIAVWVIGALSFILFYIYIF